MIETLIKGTILILLLLGAGAYMTFCERVVMARMQLRIGPNRVGPMGLLQPIADGIKLLAKERFQPAGIDIFTYWLAPAISIFIALFIFGVIPFGGTLYISNRPIELQIADIDVGILFLLSIASLAVYGIVLSGWSSNNRYSLLGSLRATAQIISYEVPMGISLITIVIMTGTLRLSEIVDMQKDHWLIWSNPISFIVYLITAFAETNRAPFDLPEAEHELTGGYHTEYGGLKFSIFFLAEYINILAVSCIAITLFLGGWHGPWDIPILWFLVKLFLFAFLFIWVRATMPRFRYDQLMNFGWKILIPLATINLLITSFIVLVL